MPKLMAVLTGIAVAFLLFLAGAVVVRFEIFPYAYLKDSLEAADALLVRERGEREVPYVIGAKPVQPEDWANPTVRDLETGVRRFDPAQAYDGYTIYTPVRFGYPIPLVNMQGEIVHQWDLPLAALAGPRDDGLSLDASENLTVAYPRLQPNGDLLVVLGVYGYTPWGVGIVKLDKNSQLLWKYTRQAHHDLDIARDGSIYGLLHTVVNEPWPGLENIETPFIDDQVVVLSPDGREQKLVSVLHAIQNSDYQSMLQYARPDRPKGDLLHVNSITYLDAGQAAFFPNASAGDVLISIRQLDVIAVMDLNQESIKWAVRGPWHAQHDPDVLPDGNVLIFDNRGDLKNGGATRLLEFDPRTLEIVWEFPGDSDEILFSSIYGSQQRLPNGNTLIAESNNGRLLEVTRAGEVVWEFFAPERKTTYDGKVLSTVVFAERFAPNELEFLQD